ncbi:unnamed protein product [Calicophoron daubneyi]|uniref:Uncharacterized protein n=1 Tax=Calicophoron daubneyi TaxID=300641 RepID=A0AAV2T393_CALDB
MNNPTAWACHPDHGYMIGFDSLMQKNMSVTNDLNQLHGKDIGSQPQSPPNYWDETQCVKPVRALPVKSFVPLMRNMIEVEEETVGAAAGDGTVPVTNQNTPVTLHSVNGQNVVQPLGPVRNSTVRPWDELEEQLVVEEAIIPTNQVKMSGPIQMTVSGDHLNSSSRDVAVGDHQDNFVKTFESGPPWDDRLQLRWDEAV